MNKINELVNTIKSVLPEVINEFNEIRLPALENAWGRKFVDELKNENQKTVEISKNFVRPINNVFYRHISEKLPAFVEETIDGSDYRFYDILIEDKNSFSPESNTWFGNGFKKTDWHLLKKFKTDDNGRITEAFICLVNIAKTNSSWSERVIQTNGSTINFQNEDEDKIIVIWGSLERKTKKLKPVTEKIQ